MFLKSLTLKGFKSFADATTVELEPGITVVVGPNGSGKSNVVDAVAWVLGAQGPRTVRSSKMEDVIFAGSARRPALGRAEVCLTIDNSSGLVPIELSEVTITRTLFRAGDSEYAINGVPCRLLDVQELLSDTGVGRQQHVIVSQGQLATILDARPEDRRLVVEEAAGVLKYRRRREKAQRRLEATDANLVRLQDLVREVRRQLRPLERQAEAARRHGGLVDELAALRLHLVGRDLTALDHRQAEATRARSGLAAAAAALRAELAGVDTAVAAAESALAALEGASLGDHLVRFEGLRERARGLAAVLAERRRSVERELQARLDEGVVAALEAEAGRLAAELDGVEGEAAALVPVARELAAAEDEVAAERAAFDEPWDGAPGDAPGQAAELRGELAALRRAVDRGRAELGRLEARRTALAQRGERLAGEIAALGATLAEAEEAERSSATAVQGAAIRRGEAQAVAAEAEVALRVAEQAEHGWAGRAEALALALDEARARAGAARLAEVPGVVGTLLELVEVDAGWEAAFEAAAGEAVAAVVVNGVASARRALEHLRSGPAGATGGAVLALDPASGSPASLALEAVVAGSDPVRAHVRSGLPAVESLLDTLLAHAVAAPTWEDALDLALAHPGLVVVTLEGDRFAPSGWRAGASGTGVTGAALAEARGRAEEAAAAAEAARGGVVAARARVAGAEEAEAEAAGRLRAAAARVATTGQAIQRLEAERRDGAVEDDAVAAHLGELAERLRGDESRTAELEALLPAVEAEEAAGAERALAMVAARRRLDERATAVAALRRDLEVRAAGLEERRGLLSRRRDEVEGRLRRHGQQRAAAAERRAGLERLAVTTARLADLVGQRLQVADAVLVRLHERHRRSQSELRAGAEHLDGLRRRRADVEARLGDLAERARQAELDEAEARLRLEAAAEAAHRELGRSPEEARAAGCPGLPPGTSADERARALERELRLMGPVNPLALEEFTALEGRRRHLEDQLEDVRSGRRDLARVIRAVDAEIAATFAAAFADVAENFARLFEVLFPGGTGRLRLTDPDDLLETGIEVEARPSGKNVRKLSLLSGGERALTALAFLFAVFRSRPSPFYLLDEVEAALDDVNLHRFLDLLDEFRGEAQLLVVSHQKRTMEAADRLYGVTMPPGGSSRVVTERLRAPAAG